MRQTVKRILGTAFAASFIGLIGGADIATQAQAQYYRPQPQYDDEGGGPPPPPRYRQPGYDERNDGGYDRPGYRRPPPPRMGGNWRPCARERGFCQAPGGAMIRYGAGGYFTVRRAPPGGLPCNNRVFGDPAPGMPKSCFVRW